MRSDQPACEHQTPTEKKNHFKCAIGLYGGIPLIGNCLTCVRENQNNEEYAKALIETMSRAHPAGKSRVSGCCDSAENY